MSEQQLIPADDLLPERDIPQPPAAPPRKIADPLPSPDTFLQDIEKGAIETALTDTRWNRAAAAQKLGISFRSL